MNMHEREERRQAEAEAAERRQLPPGGDPAVDEYRLVIRALRQPLPEALPADFAARVARRLRFAEERGSLEDWLVTVLMLGLAGAGLVYLLPVLARVAGRLHVDLPTLPWPLLGAAALAVACAWVVDRGASHWRDGHGRH
jgi:hypothetical protein